MTDLNQIITVNISRNTTTPSQVGFGTALLLVSDVPFLERVRTYSSLTGLTDDGFATTDIAYKMASDLLAQNPSPNQFKVGRRALAPTQSITFTPLDLTEGLTYTMTITGPGGPTSLTGETFSYVVQNLDDEEAIVDGLIAAMAANVGSWTPAKTGTGSSAVLDIDADVAGELFGFSGMNDKSILAIIDVTPDPGVSTDLAAIVEQDNDWYCLLLDSNSEAEINGAASWVESNEKVMFAQSADTEVLSSISTTDIAADLTLAGYDRTVLFYHRLNQDFIACAFAGNVLPEIPGSITGAYRVLSSINSDNLSTNDLAVLDGKECNHFSILAGVSVTRYGVVSSGEYFDVIRGSDWLAARLQERIYGVLINNDKLPFTDAGIAVVQNEILSQLQIGVSNGFLSGNPEPTVTVPLASEVSAADKGNRFLTGVTFRATLAGAIHKVAIEGELNL